MPRHARCWLEAVAEGAQRIARLALGVTTENVGNVRDPYSQMSAQEFRINSVWVAAQSMRDFRLSSAC